VVPDGHEAHAKLGLMPEPLLVEHELHLLVLGLNTLGLVHALLQLPEAAIYVPPPLHLNPGLLHVLLVTSYVLAEAQDMHLLVPG
jgi:hypothetical protein